MRVDEGKLAFARKLRREMTDEERVLWSYLRNRQFLGLKFRRQVPVGPYVVDFLCESAKLVVELDGWQHGEREAYDVRRTGYLKTQGYRVVRYNNAEVRNMDELLNHLARLIQEPEP